MTPQQVESIRQASRNIRHGIDKALAQRTPEQKQQELTRLVEAAHRLLGNVQQAKGDESA